MKRYIILLVFIHILGFHQVTCTIANKKCVKWGQWTDCTDNYIFRFCEDAKDLYESIECKNCGMWTNWSECKDNKQYRQMADCDFIKESKDCNEDAEKAKEEAKQDLELFKSKNHNEDNRNDTNENDKDIKEVKEVKEIIHSQIYPNDVETHDLKEIEKINRTMDNSMKEHKIPQDDNDYFKYDTSESEKGFSSSSDDNKKAAESSSQISQQQNIAVIDDNGNQANNQEIPFSDSLRNSRQADINRHNEVEDREEVMHRILTGSYSLSPKDHEKDISLTQSTEENQSDSSEKISDHSYINQGEKENNQHTGFTLTQMKRDRTKQYKNNQDILENSNGPAGDSNVPKEDSSKLMNETGSSEKHSESVAPSHLETSEETEESSDPTFKLQNTTTTTDQEQGNINYDKIYFAGGIAFVVLLAGGSVIYILKKKKGDEELDAENKEENYEVLFNEDNAKNKNNNNNNK